MEQKKREPQPERWGLGTAFLGHQWDDLDDILFWAAADAHGPPAMPRLLKEVLDVVGSPEEFEERLDHLEETAASTIEELGPPPPFYEDDSKIDWRQEFATKIQLLIQLIRTAEQSTIPIHGLAFYLGVLASQAHQEVDVLPWLLRAPKKTRKPKTLLGLGAYIKQRLQRDPRRRPRLLWEQLPSTPYRVEVGQTTFIIYRDHFEEQGDVVVQRNERTQHEQSRTYETFRQYVRRIKREMVS